MWPLALQSSQPKWLLWVSLTVTFLQGVNGLQIVFLKYKMLSANGFDQTALPTCGIMSKRGPSLLRCMIWNRKGWNLLILSYSRNFNIFPTSSSLGSIWILILVMFNMAQSQSLWITDSSIYTTYREQQGERGKRKNPQNHNSKKKVSGVVTLHRIGLSIIKLCQLSVSAGQKILEKKFQFLVFMVEPRFGHEP